MTSDIVTPDDNDKALRESLHHTFWQIGYLTDLIYSATSEIAYEQDEGCPNHRNLAGLATEVTRQIKFIASCGEQLALKNEIDFSEASSGLAPTFTEIRDKKIMCMGVSL